MNDFTVECPGCGVELTFDQDDVGAIAECPSCGNELVLELPGQGTIPAPMSVPLAPLAPPAPPPAPPAPPPPTGISGELPERMRANRDVADRICTKCGSAINFGDDAFNCDACGTSMHGACHDDNGGCANPHCRKNAVAEPVAAPLSTTTPLDAPFGGPLGDVTPLRDNPPLSPQAEAIPEETKACKFCGEQIRIRARKCPFCKEYQEEQPAVEQSVGGIGSAGYDEDDNLTGAEIALGILCGTIACIVGIVWMCQGKKKGLKMIALSIVSQIIRSAIMAAIRAS
ncbi:MAG: hypothetical protein KAI66_12115 [Lentisphaeria bacterium]|nr:hypothetical protein [Lentisphaeria bacterium]